MVENLHKFDTFMCQKTPSLQKIFYQKLILVSSVRIHIWIEINKCYISILILFCITSFNHNKDLSNSKLVSINYSFFGVHINSIYWFLFKTFINIFILITESLKNLLNLPEHDHCIEGSQVKKQVIGI